MISVEVSLSAPIFACSELIDTIDWRLLMGVTGHRRFFHEKNLGLFAKCHSWEELLVPWLNANVRRIGLASEFACGKAKANFTAWAS